MNVRYVISALFAGLQAIQHRSGVDKEFMIIIYFINLYTSVDLQVFRVSCRADLSFWVRFLLWSLVIHLLVLRVHFSLLDIGGAFVLI